MRAAVNDWKQNTRGLRIALNFYFQSIEHLTDSDSSNRLLCISNGAGKQEQNNAQHVKFIYNVIHNYKTPEKTV